MKKSKKIEGAASSMPSAPKQTYDRPFLPVMKFWALSARPKSKSLRLRSTELASEKRPVFQTSHALKKDRQAAFSLAPSLGKLLLAGALTGLVGSFFGSGGGIVAVFALRRLFPEDDPADIFASTLLVILPMSAGSALIYGLRRGFTLSHALPFLLPSLAGGALGALLSANLGGKWLKRLFALLLLIGGGTLVLRG